MEAVHKRQIPGVAFSRVWWKESAFVGAEREYLRVQRGRFVYDICAAPYGSGSFVSSWLCIVPYMISLMHLAGIMVMMIPMIILFPIAVLYFLFLMWSGYIWWLFCRTAVTTSSGTDFLLGLTGAGPILVFMAERRPTYYQIDAAAVFQTVVQEAVSEVIDGLCTAQNLRPLTELERKPSAIEFRK